MPYLGAMGQREPLTPEQAKVVDDVLARYEDYLKRLGKRVAAQGVRDPHPLPKWISKTEWHANGLRHHFAEWAKGNSPSPFPRG